MPDINPFLQTPCQVTAPCAAISFIRFAADSDAHNLQPRESANVTSPAFASADLAFDALPAFCLAASAAIGTRATRAPTITIHSLPDIVMLFASPPNQSIAALYRRRPSFDSGKKRANPRQRIGCLFPPRQESFCCGLHRAASVVTEQLAF